MAATVRVQRPECDVPLIPGTLQLHARGDVGVDARRTKEALARWVGRLYRRARGADITTAKERAVWSNDGATISPLQMLDMQF